MQESPFLDSLRMFGSKAVERVQQCTPFFRTFYAFQNLSSIARHPHANTYPMDLTTSHEAPATVAIAALPLAATSESQKRGESPVSLFMQVATRAARLMFSDKVPWKRERRRRERKKHT